MTQKNPILPGFYPDPSIVSANGRFYLATSSFEYFPGVPLFESEDLINWRQIGHCLTRESQLNLKNTTTPNGIWAPTLRFHQGTFYMITTNSGSGGHFYVYTEDIYGEWSDPVWIEGGGHDPDLFFDPSGKVYFSRFNGYDGITLWEIDLPDGKLISPPNYIFQGYEDRLCEAPHIYFIDGYYYLLAAEGGTWTGHMVTCARSRQITGPYELCPHNPILTSRHLVMSPVQATGHGDLVQKEDGSWWMVFLGTREVKRMQILGRETFLAPVHFESGWPVVNQGAPISCFDPQPEGEKIFTFSDNHLPMEWVFRRTPSADIKLIDNSCLLPCSPSGITSTTGSSSLLLLRQCHHSCEAKVTLTALLGSKESAGLCVYMNQDYYYAIRVTYRGNQKQLEVLRRVGDLEQVEGNLIWDREEVTLSIRHQDNCYYLGYYDGQTFIELGKGLSRLISSDLANTFTGMFFGLFAETTETTTGNVVSFSDFIYRYWEGFNQGKQNWTA